MQRYQQAVMFMYIRYHRLKLPTPPFVNNPKYAGTGTQMVG